MNQGSDWSYLEKLYDRMTDVEKALEGMAGDRYPDADSGVTSGAGGRSGEEPHTEPRPTRTARTVPASSPDSVAGARRSSGLRRTDNQPVHAARPADRNLHDSPVGRTPAAPRPRRESRNRPAGTPPGAIAAAETIDQEQPRRGRPTARPRRPPRRGSPDAGYPSLFSTDACGFSRFSTHKVVGLDRGKVRIKWWDRARKVRIKWWDVHVDQNR